MKPRLSVEAYTEGVLEGDRAILSRAITLVESTLPTDRLLAQQVLQNILPHTGQSVRVGITGVPGVGKSTFIEAFGELITNEVGYKLAVLAIDPTSQRSLGSIMGDKTRMEQLAHNPKAYIRPSPSGGALGGVAQKTRETLLLCEAAGFEVIIVETVGVGQSETTVKGMVDFFLLLMLAGAGDELQGIKKGIMEMADAVVITKADAQNRLAAQQAATEYQNALHLFPVAAHGWLPSVLLCSALQREGLKEVWELIQNYVEKMQLSGFFNQNRQFQNAEWMHSFIRQKLQQDFYENEAVKKLLEQVEDAVKRGEKLPIQAAQMLLAQYKR
jgi:LAO/AO transport system kinase